MSEANPAEIRILVVEDDTDVACGTARLLERAGYAIAIASDGVDALKTMQTFHPHLVLSDRNMPAMDGMEMCRRIKTDPAYADVFVILISGTFTQSAEQVAGLNSGADGYIVRPIDNSELVARMEAYVRILRLNQILREKNAALEAALTRVKLLSGLLPICAACKQIRDDKGYWNQLEKYLQEHSEAIFSHSLCPACSKIYFPDLEDEGFPKAP